MGDAQEETAWLQEIARGDRQAFECLFRAYEKRLFRYFQRLLGEAAVAEELTIDVMLEVWRGAGRFRGEAKPSTWIFGIAHHKGVSALRRRKPVAIELAEAGPLPAATGNPEVEAARRRLREKIQRALLALSPSHREVVELTFYQGLTCQEIAAVLKCPLNTVKTRMFYARKQLQPILAEVGVGGEG